MRPRGPGVFFVGKVLTRVTFFNRKNYPYFLFLLMPVLVSGVFEGIFPFYLNYHKYWYKVFIISSIILMYAKPIDIYFFIPVISD